jgi:hypothetical protein
VSYCGSAGRIIKAFFWWYIRQQWQAVDLIVAKIEINSAKLYGYRNAQRLLEINHGKEAGSLTSDATFQLKSPF